MSEGETLRTAAKLMQDRANDAMHHDAKYEPGVWVTEHHNSQHNDYPERCHIAEDRTGVYWSVAHEVYIPIAEHMAGLDPRTALLIAKWLERAARQWWWLRDRAALAVAVAYLAAPTHDRAVARGSEVDHG